MAKRRWKKPSTLLPTAGDPKALPRTNPDQTRVKLIESPVEDSEFLELIRELDQT